MSEFAKVSGEDVAGAWRAYRARIGDYMERWVLNTPFGTLRVHHILRSDDAGSGLHDHPWDFWSFLLTGGYHEVIPDAMEIAERWPGYAPARISVEAQARRGQVRRVWRRRFTLLRRKAEDPHRLELVKPVWTLVWTGPMRRKWGFYSPKGWVYWRDVERPHRERA